VITGFNTDIVYQGVTYHVQTEDKGLDTPLILSLVYDRGTILASKRSPYEDLLKIGFDEQVLLERLQKQHKVICAAIKAGRIDDLKRMTLESAAKQKNASTKTVISTVEGFKPEKPIGKPEPPIAPAPKIEQKRPEPKLEEVISRVELKEIDIPAVELKPKPKVLEVPKIEVKPEPTPKILETPKVEIRQELKTPEVKVLEPLKIEMPKEDLDVPIKISESEIVFDDVQIVEDEVILASEAVEVIADFTIHEPLPKDSLAIELVNDNGFKGGDRKTLSIVVANGNTAICNASVMVKVLGSAFRPLIFHAKTDSNGVAVVHLQLPHFRSGRAAILIKAMSGGEEAELRRVVSQG
jgi:hypothetical protein